MILAALATLIFGAVLGPEMPLILLGGGLAALAVRLARRPVPDRARAVVASAGSFAAISTLLGSPLVGAFLLMEASGLGGPMLGLVAIPGLPSFGRPDLAEFGWAVVIGLAAALIGRSSHPGVQPASYRNGDGRDP